MFSLCYLPFCPSLLPHLDTLNPRCCCVSASDYTKLYRQDAHNPCQSNPPPPVPTEPPPCRGSSCSGRRSSEAQVTTEAAKCIAALPHYDNPPKEKLHGLQACTSTGWLGRAERNPPGAVFPLPTGGCMRKPREHCVSLFHRLPCLLLSVKDSSIWGCHTGG